MSSAHKSDFDADARSFLLKHGLQTGTIAEGDLVRLLDRAWRDGFLQGYGAGESDAENRLPKPTDRSEE